MEMFLPEGFYVYDDFGDGRMVLADGRFHLVRDGVGLGDRQTVIDVDVEIHVYLGRRTS